MKGKKIILLIILIISSFFISLPMVKATHMLGADITWACIGKDSFVIKLVIYRDCNGVNLGTPSISIECASTGVNITTFSISKPPPVDITPVCTSSCTRCQSTGCSFPYGIEQYTFTKLVVLSNAGSCCDLIISYQECCRNSTITTGAANTNFYIDAKMNRCQNPCDNSPSFTNPPIAIICVGQDFIFNHGVFDVDIDSNGDLIDSLSYSWTQPLTGAGSYAPWTSPYSYDKPLLFWGFPYANQSSPLGFHLDPFTGNISFRPMKVEQTIMALKVTEWRKINGTPTKIGEITRDVHYMFISCPTSNNPVLNGTAVKHICAGDSVTLPIYSSDADVNDWVTLTAYNLPPGAVWTDNNGLVKNPTGMVRWRTKPSDISTQPYNILIKAKDNSCTVPGQSSQVFSIYVHPGVSAKIKYQKLPCNQYKLIADEIIGTSFYKWYVNGISVNGLITIDKAGNYITRLELIGQSCTFNVFDTLQIASVLKCELPNDTVLCPGNSVTVLPNITGAQGKLNYLWNTGDTSSSLTIGPLFQDTMIILNVSDSMFCHSDTMFIKVDNFGVTISQDNIVCPGQASELTAYPLFDKGKQAKSFLWLDLSCSCPKSYADTVVIYSSGAFSCTVTDEFGCTASDTFIATFHQKPQITISPLPSKCLNDSDFNLNPYASPPGGLWLAQQQNLIENDTFFISKAQAGQYLLFYQYTDPSTSCSNTEKTTLTIKKYPEISIIKPFSFCNLNTLIDLSDYVSPANGIWDSSHPAIIHGHFINPIIAYHYSLPLTYSVFDTNGCSDTKSISYIVFPQPKADFHTNLTSGYSPLYVQFFNQSSIDSGILSYFWNFGDGDTSSAINPLHLYADTGHYSVSLKVVSDYGCADSLTKNNLIYVYPVAIPELVKTNFKVYPNPSHDKIFIESEIGLQKISLYNITGKIIFESDETGSHTAELTGLHLSDGLYLLKITDLENNTGIFHLGFQ
ncbi:MAG TPA: PKD domain-containing protein [Bacteroidia bacterium]|nr:PKD domain-containing protein [Bacteroidia bacterium]HRS58694.1 PKD domain-containing protein [Bacteroidia bacterium]